MRIANVGGRLAPTTREGAVDVARATSGRFSAEPADAYGRWPELREWADGYDGPAEPLADDVPLGPPSPTPRQVFAIGLNYARHARESGMDLPEFPATFTKFPTSLAAPDATVSLPSANVDWEVELVVVVGRAAHEVDAADGWAHVAGLTVGQDLSERRVQLRPPVPQFSLGKSYPGFAPIGPLLVTPDELPDPDDLEISCTLNGEQVQHARTSDLVFSVPELISQLSSVVRLLPGDLIFTGTPSGIGAARKPPRYLAPGDELHSTIEGIGTLRTRFRNGVTPDQAP
jgi:2,4-didehydro-3-deoxy-L-rhamnonate hydrolase